MIFYHVKNDRNFSSWFFSMTKTLGTFLSWFFIMRKTLGTFLSWFFIRKWLFGQFFCSYWEDFACKWTAVFFDGVFYHEEKTEFWDYKRRRLGWEKSVEYFALRNQVAVQILVTQNIHKKSNAILAVNKLTSFYIFTSFYL